MFIDWCLAQLSSERLHPATDGKRCRDPQPDIRQSQRILWKRGRKDCGASVIKDTTRKPTASITWAHGGSATELTTRECT